MRIQISKLAVGLCLGGLSLLGGCTYSAPPPSPDVESVVGGDLGKLAQGGIDRRFAGYSSDQRSPDTGITTDTDDNRHIGPQPSMGDPANKGNAMEGKTVFAGRDEGTEPRTEQPPPDRNRIVYAPSDETWVNGETIGPSPQRQYVDGSPAPSPR